MMRRISCLVLFASLIACDSANDESDVAVDAADASDASDAVDGAADAESDTPDVAPDAIDVAPDLPPDGTGDSDDPGDAVDDETSPDADADSDDADAAPPEPEFADWDHMTPWVAPSLEWSTCEHSADGSLAAKAAYYDWIVPALHQVPTDVEGHEDWSRVFHINCDGDVPAEIVADEALPTCTFSLSENNGLWTSLYIASQAYRFAATGDDAALQQVLRTLRATHRMMRITGSQGLFTRDFRDPSIPQQYCPSDPMEYVPMGSDMIGNRWVRVGDDGCIVTWDPALNDGAGDWVSDPTHCTSEEFAGYCWQRNVSKDEYSGHFYAATLVAKLVDDEEAQTLAREILREAGRHLIANEYWITDYDGRPTRFGSAHAMSLDHIPGFNALMALSWTRSALSVTQDEAFADFYYGCLLQRRPVEDCIDAPLERAVDYRTYLTDFALQLGCQTNYDNVSIGTLVYAGLMLMEPDPELQATYRAAFQEHSRGPDIDGRDLWAQGNAQFNFTLAALMGPDPESDADALQLVGDAVCSLYDFRSDNIRREVSNPDVPVECVSRRHGNLAAEPMPIAQRCSSVFEWWGDPAQIENCAAQLDSASPPAGYLLPYWMARYHGFVSAEM